MSTKRMEMDRGHSRAGARRGGTILVGLLPLVSLAATSCGNAAGAPGAQEGETAFQRVINVEVLPLASRGFEQRVRITGTAQANFDVTISAEEAGVIREVAVDKGATVSEGQPLFRIDDRILRAQMAEAEAREGLARETWLRRQRLFEVDGVGSELAYLEARYQAEQAEAALATLRERLARTVVRAPIGGILESREVEVGSLVAPGVPLARVVQVDPIKVTGGVPERYAGEVTRGASATVTFDVLPEQTLRVPVRYVGATVNPRNRTFAVELVVPNPGHTIKPEMVANIEIIRSSLDQAIVIPQEAVVRVEGGYVAFVVEDEGSATVAKVRPLVLGTSQRNQVVVEEGLSAGDRLIVAGQTQVADGDQVRIVGTRDSGSTEADR